MASTDRIYECAQKLQQANKDGFHVFESEFRVVLTGVKGDGRAKRMASQTIARYFVHFPTLTKEALNAILDLCEDDDLNIRKLAIMDLAKLSKDAPELLPKIVDVLSQLLQSDEPSELNVIENSLMSLFRRDAKGTLVGIFSQIKTGGEEVRERALDFLLRKIKAEGSALLNKEAEAILFQEIKGSLKNCTAEEFQMFMNILDQTSIPKMLSGQAQLLQLATMMADLDKPFDPEDTECVGKFVECAKTASKFLSSQVKGTEFCSYICLEILPQFHSIEDANAQSQILKILAECSQNTAPLKESLKATQNIFKKLLDYVPLPPADAAEKAGIETPDFEFTKVECLLSAYHNIGRDSPEYLTGNPERLEDFKKRLTYFARCLKVYIKKLNDFLQQSGNKTKPEHALKSLALKCTTNINTLILDLMRNTPLYKAKITLSWVEERKVPTKRTITAITSAGNGVQTNKKARKSFDSSQIRPKSKSPGRGGKVYAPPTGKFSSKVGQFDNNGGGRRGGSGRGRGRGRFRGRKSY